jgi:hypothetical protein
MILVLGSVGEVGALHILPGSSMLGILSLIPRTHLSIRILDSFNAFSSEIRTSGAASPSSRKMLLTPPQEEE